MNRYGILGRYLPEFGLIVGQMQHDLFHIYTVDAHTLNLIKHLRKLQYTPVSEKFPLASKLMGRLPKSELIYLAGLYHDIGKGRQGDHSELGAVDAQAFCERHQLPAWDSRLIVWLVLNHLVMSTTAQRKDLSDPQVINDFALHVGDETRLDYLYVLTVADINATNPSLWNSWRASLLRQLKHFDFPPQVTILNDAQRPVTILEITAPDRPGLLARIGRIFLEFDLSLQNAKIATLGERVEDVFFITDADNQPLSDPQLCSRLQEAIVQQLQAGQASDASPTRMTF